MRERTRKALCAAAGSVHGAVLVPAAYATPENGTWQVPFTEVEDAQVLELREPVEETTPETLYDANETVRVSIVLEEPSTLSGAMPRRTLLQRGRHGLPLRPAEGPGNHGTDHFPAGPCLGKSWMWCGT